LGNGRIRTNNNQKLIPIATDWKATDWLIANCFLQEQILNNSSKPIQDARTRYVVL
jgi:homoserine O-acetyltransferase